MEETPLEVDKAEEVIAEIPDSLVISETVPELEPKSAEVRKPTGKIFIGEEDKRLLRKFNEHIVKKLGVGGNRSFKI